MPRMEAVLLIGHGGFEMLEHRTDVRVPSPGPGEVLIGVRAAADRDVSGVGADLALPGDLRDPAYADGLPSAAAKGLGRLDILVNNAGVITRARSARPPMPIGRCRWR